MIAHPVARAALVLLGLIAVALGLGLFTGGDTDESEEVVFAAAVLITGVLNVAAGSLANQMQRLGTVAVTADAMLLGFVFYMFSQASIG